MPPETTEYTAERGRLVGSQARWGAILAGVALALALLIFFQVLGLAIGVSVIDLSDAEALGDGLGIGAAIWSVLSWCASLFLGAMLTARLSGEGNETVGMLNGAAAWAVTSLIVLAMAFSSMASVVGGTVSLASSTVSGTVSGSVSAVTSTGRAVGQAVESGASALSDSDSAVADEVIVLLKEEASEAVASGSGPQGATAAEIRRSIDQLDEDAVRDFAAGIVEGDLDAATEALADDIAMSERELRNLVDRASQRVQRLLGTAGNEQPLSEDVLDQTKAALASGLEDAASRGGSDVERSEIRMALDDLDAEVLQTIAWRLVQGDADAARNTLIANTSLTRAEADELITGIETNLEQTVSRYREQAEEYADEAGDVAQGVLWVAVLVTVLSFMSSALGGWIGTRPIARRTVHATPPAPAAPARAPR